MKTIEETATLLNKALDADGRAMEELIRFRVPCDPEVEQAGIRLQKDTVEFSMSIMGVLNAIYADEESVLGCDFDGYGMLMRFVVLTPEQAKENAVRQEPQTGGVIERKPPRDGPSKTAPRVIAPEAVAASVPGADISGMKGTSRAPKEVLAVPGGIAEPSQIGGWRPVSPGEQKGKNGK